MKPAFKNFRIRTGIALVLSMIFLVLLSALAISVTVMSDSNAQMAVNHKKGNAALINAESGMEVIRYWLKDISLPDWSSAQLEDFLGELESKLSFYNITNINLDADGNVAEVSLNSSGTDKFTANIVDHPTDPNLVRVSVTGYHENLTRTIRADFTIDSKVSKIFDFGLATKGPVLFNGNPTIEGINNGSEADMYIESLNNITALSVTGNTNFDGNINVVNQNGDVQFGGDINIAGENGSTAIDNHVSIGVEDLEFPIPDTDHFRQYLSGNTIDSSTDLSKGMTLTNTLIEAGTNPTFGGSVIVKGVLFIESPNQVIFNSNVDVRGIIVGDGDAENPGSDEMIFNGNFASSPVPDEFEFENMVDETGSTLVAPGFKTTIAGNFASVGGTIAVSGFHLSGNANAVVKGSILNYSNETTIIEGNATLRFDLSSNTKTPAGFLSPAMLKYEPSTWTMMH